MNMRSRLREIAMSLTPEVGRLVMGYRMDSVMELLRALEKWRPVRVERWLDRETR